MKWIWVLSTVILGALAGATLLHDPGYVLIRVGDLVFESSIAAGVIIIMILASAVSISVYISHAAKWTHLSLCQHTNATKHCSVWVVLHS